ncbi:DNA-processing protein DprA [Planococcus shenhongbingii]|uniref:DNA-processing protein DprA n=1 Tax=Planococcus shenhongbingii TaxID=3058398 RepID=A0ABT8N8J6_9BACL|nr:DNA-processing protein DprA [Planococcus sp. N017]MDN7244200.1 DNA-processing protein DprA [Planococcus sp. N017]
MTEDFWQRLLALHYVYPKPLNRLNRLMIDDPELEKLYRRKPFEIAALMEISLAQANQLKTAYAEALTIPFKDLYEKHKITPVSFHHPNYPVSLLDLIDPPAILYAKGRIELLLSPEKIAVIGSRNASHYSQKAINAILPPLVEQQCLIVSGLAKGADAMAHATAIELGGQTIAVTGSGFLHPYPKENAGLHSIIEEKYLSITEYPPYMQPKRWNFPMRNRIISGLSQGILVTEAKAKSGTLSTVEHALDHGKDIFAVPGDIFSALSEGPHKLIAEGAKPVWKGSQILEEYRLLRAEK